MDIFPHTRGPWQMVHSAATRSVYIVGDQGKVYVATVEDKAAHARKAYSAPKENAEANARLIAAAPELLEALELFRVIAKSSDILPDKMSDKTWMELFFECAEKAEAAIRKAKGE